MKIASCLVLLTIGTSFLLPSETQKFFLFVIAAVLALLLVKDRLPTEEVDGLDRLEKDEYTAHWFDEGLVDFIRDKRSSM